MLVQVADPENDPENDPVKSNILQQLKQNPKANYGELADKTGCWKVIEVAAVPKSGINPV